MGRPPRAGEPDPEDRLAVAEFGPVAPALGCRARGAGRAAWAHPARAYVATTTQAAGLFPFVAGSGAPTAGVPLGRHALWGEVVCLDPFAWMDAGLITNTGMFLLGQPGVGKSALAKRLTLAMPAFGVRPIILGDTKGEHTAIIAALGGQVIRVGRGLDRINPLDAGPLGSAADLLPADRAAAGRPRDPRPAADLPAGPVRAGPRHRRRTGVQRRGGAARPALDLLAGGGQPQPDRARRPAHCSAPAARSWPPPRRPAPAATTTTRTRELRHTLDLLLHRVPGRRVRRAHHPPDRPGRPRGQRRHLRHRRRRGHPGRRRDAVDLVLRLRRRRRRRRCWPTPAWPPPGGTSW